MEVREIIKFDDLEKAYSCLTLRKNNRIIGGCTFLKRTGFMIGTGIALDGCNLDYIKKDKDSVLIGACTSLRSIETSDIITEEFGTFFSDSLKHLVGVQLRNMITIGAHLASRFGFSDIIPSFMAMNAKLRFYHRGIIKLSDYMEMDKVEKDILIEIILPLERRTGKVQMMRESYSDYSIFCLAVSRYDEDWIIAGGVFPGRARLAGKTMNAIKDKKVDINDKGSVADMITDEFTFGSNARGSAQYRKHLCYVFAKRAIGELVYDN